MKVGLGGFDLEILTDRDVTSRLAGLAHRIPNCPVGCDLAELGLSLASRRKTQNGQQKKPSGDTHGSELIISPGESLCNFATSRGTHVANLLVRARIE